MRRHLKCSCGSKKAQMYSCGLGCYLFIHCPECNRTLDGPRVQLSPSGRGWDATPRQRAAYKDALRARWDNGEKNL